MRNAHLFCQINVLLLLIIQQSSLNPRDRATTISLNPPDRATTISRDHTIHRAFKRALLGKKMNVFDDVRIWASVKLGDTLGMPIWLETINGI